MRRPVLLLLLGLAGAARASDRVDYARDIKPLLAAKCAACHGALAQEAGLRLDTGALVVQGGDDGAVVIPGDAESSRLLLRVASADIAERMPPEGEGEALSAEQVALLRAWINSGAHYPADETIPAKPQDHWAFQPPRRPDVPDSVDPNWSHPIDAFLQQQRESAGVEAVDIADRATLLRRAHLDLTGLPPTRSEQQAFLDNDSPDAWAEVVDALLASPHYGERWARHWMDVWRYSDWDGYRDELRGSQRHIWRWRDWIIRSLNEDKGYDRMVVEMLAGDEIAPGDPDALAATGFLGRNYHNSNRNMWLDATVEHTAKALLGITLNCARCHDHKYDPIPQQAYYEFRAIFEPHKVRTDRLPSEQDVLKDGLSRTFDAEPEAKTFVYVHGNEKQPDESRPLAAAVPGALGGVLDVKPAPLPVEAYYPSIRRFAMEEQLAAAQKDLAAEQSALAAALVASCDEASGNNPEASQAANVDLLNHKRDAARSRVLSLEARQAAERAKYLGELDEGDSLDSLAVAAAAAERTCNVDAARLEEFAAAQALAAARAAAETDESKKQAAIDAAEKLHKDAGEKLAKAAEAARQTDGNYSPLGDVYPSASTGRRLALARWITSRDNPLAARVAVNHIWLRHFGEPLVDNVFDFGLRSPRPRHADLLDWLAVELIESDWSMKRLHRLILTSRTWRLASSSTASFAERNDAVDTDNKLLWRSNIRRLEAEIVRDALMAVAGELDEAEGGPDVPFTEGETSRRRSVYLQHAYEKQMAMLVQFDAANPGECYERSASIVPQQALALVNSPMSLGHSRLLARRLWAEASSRSDADQAATFVRIAFAQALSRGPTAEELDACVQFLAEQSKTLADPSMLTAFAGGGPSQVEPADDPHQRARENLIHVLLNHNDFITVR